MRSSAPHEAGTVQYNNREPYMTQRTSRLVLAVAALVCVANIGVTAIARGQEQAQCPLMFCDMQADKCQEIHKVCLCTYICYPCAPVCMNW